MPRQRDRHGRACPGHPRFALMEAMQRAFVYNAPSSISSQINATAFFTPASPTIYCGAHTNIAKD
jgi:hypothetical protein